MSMFYVRPFTDWRNHSECLRSSRPSQKLVESLKCENDWNSKSFQNKRADLITHTWTTYSMENPWALAAHARVCVRPTHRPSDRQPRPAQIIIRLITAPVTSPASLCVSAAESCSVSQNPLINHTRLLPPPAQVPLLFMARTFAEQ